MGKILEKIMCNNKKKTIVVTAMVHTTYPVLKERSNHSSVFLPSYQVFLKLHEKHFIFSLGSTSLKIAVDKLTGKKNYIYQLFCNCYLHFFLSVALLTYFIYFYSYFYFYFYFVFNFF